MFTKKRCTIAAAIISNAIIAYGVSVSYNELKASVIDNSSITVSFEKPETNSNKIYNVSGSYYTIDTENTDLFTNPVYGVINNDMYYVAEESADNKVEFDFSDLNDDVLCLGQNIYHEARGENYEGKVLVGQVTLNRVKAKRWRDTVCGVVYQRHQFEWVDLKMFMDMSTQRERDSFMESLAIAHGILSGEIPDISKKADHYFNPKGVKRQPSWPAEMTLVQVVGNHQFYRDN